jgi:hypothetical protein
MQNILTVFLFLFLFVSSALSQQVSVPFRVEIEEYSAVNSPALQSYVAAEMNGKWLLVGGRTNGLHNFPSPPNNTAFPTQFANKMIYVYDPVTDNVWSRSIYLDLPFSVTEQLRSTNMQSYFTGSTMYLIGGYGKDTLLSTAQRDSFVTFPKLTAIDVNGIMNAVMNNTSISSFVRSISDTNLAVTGGDLKKLDDTYLLVVGQKFTGVYGFTSQGFQSGVQNYTEQIRKFNIIDDGTNLSISNFQTVTDPATLHRRDLNVVNVINSSGQPELRIYGGVFTAETSTWNNPVNISLTSVNQDNNFSQRFSQYQCANIGLYDSVYNRMSTILFGGISLYSYDTVTNTPFIDTTGCGGPCIPFINNISVITKYSDGSYKDSLLSLRFPQNRLMGSEAIFFPDNSVPNYSNGVIKLNSLTGRTFAGYIHGGIDATPAGTDNPFMEQMFDRTKRGRSGSGTIASNKIYKVYITPNVVSINPIGNAIPEKYNLSQNYPNPFNPVTNIGFEIPKSGVVKIDVYDVLGKHVVTLLNDRLDAGKYETVWNADKMPSGVYYYSIEVNDFKENRKMILLK